MREEEVGMRYLSPLVKQDLAKLDADAESRRLALKSLKQFVEQLDAASMARFLTQIAESRESGGSRAYAISLYEEVARVHGKVILPHIPRVMTSLIRSLAASGSSPQLQQACAKVTVGLAQYTIDPATPPGEAEDILRELCDPLAEALAGKLEPVAAGAAACLHALVESEKWKHACAEVVDEVCQRTALALSERSTRTVMHMQLVLALAAASPDALSVYGVSLLRAGEEVLKVAANPWQHRKTAAKLLQAVLTILDKGTLETELDCVLHALDSCRLDRMPHVRAAVSEALHTAKLLASGNATQTSVGVAASPVRKPSPAEARGRSPRIWINENAPVSPVSKRAASPTSQESHHLSFSPASTSTSTTESMHLEQVSSPARSASRRAKRAPLYPARGMGSFAPSPGCGSTLGTSPSSSTTEECESPSHQLDAKENVRSRPAAVNGVVSQEADLGNAKYARPRAPVTSGAYTPLLPSQLDAFGIELPKAAREAQDLNDNAAATADLPGPYSVAAADTATLRPTTPSPSAIVNEPTDDGARLAQCGRGSGVKVVLPRLRLGSLNGPEGVVGGGTPPQGPAGPAAQNGKSAKSTKNQSEERSADGDVEVEKREIVTAAATGLERGEEAPVGDGRVNILTHHYNALAHLDVGPEEEKSKSLITAKDFLPFAAPKRLMRGLQSAAPSPEARGSSLEQDMKLAQDNAAAPSGLTPRNPDVGDADVETSSDAGWSVRDNPIASDESFRAESSDEELAGERRRGVYEAFAYPRKVASADGMSPREFSMISPVYRRTRSYDGHNDGARAQGPADGDATCASCALDRARASSRVAKDFQIDGGKPAASSGLSSVCHEDATQDHCEHVDVGKGSEAAASVDDDAVDADSSSRSVSAKQRRSWWDRGVGQYVVVRTATRKWRKVCWYAEMVLGGSLCVVLALPLAMAVAKALSGPREYHLVPT